ncbi:hypothetical protein Q3V94_09500 [Caloramator sp. CAR-1]|uniref:hypothetical protein n=1 Tax=Caloramator sp. CAR-1 TaxID=3062777 RepID=UPI0026E145EC|nr:hypothetical protein [Caloramator sp. CAR-1]MDO6355294.1 hypothetical protein [Caloramator sp. CAR-1]
MPIDAKEIFQMVIENQNKLKSCSRHDFSIDITADRALGKRYRCSNCGGEVDSIEKYWYEKGLEHSSMS